jgi:putative SOS response-associated peptidase YedK
MCNETAQERAWKAYCEMMSRQDMPIISDEPPELPFGPIRPSERAAVISAAPGGSTLEVLPWGWKKADAKGLVLWIRAKNRRDPPLTRGVVPIERFYEYRGAKAPKDKFEFTPALNEPIGMAVIKKDGRWAHMTTEPGPEVFGIHKRQPALLRLSQWPRFLTAPTWPHDLLAPTEAGTLKALQVR